MPVRPELVYGNESGKILTKNIQLPKDWEPMQIMNISENPDDMFTGTRNNGWLAKTETVVHPFESKFRNRRRTKTFMDDQRKNELKADKSYDLNGNGGVNPREYFIAKRFDKDNDGKLNEVEKKAAIEALQSGYEQKFMFGLERS